MKIVLLIVIIILIAIIAELVYENIFAMNVRRERFMSKEKADKSVKIVQISDIHKRRFGKENRRIAELTEAENPDLIFVTGDLVSRTEKNFSTAEKLLRRLSKVAPVYLIFGNHEQSLPEKLVPGFVDAVIKSGAKLLQNEASDITVNGRILHIYGYDPPYSTYKKNGGYKDLDQVEHDDIERAVGAAPQGEVLLLAHNPFFAEAYSQWGADYTFSGHIHGGVVRLFGRGLLSPERKFLPAYSKGVYDVESMKLCVSAGLGKLRFCNSPEIVVYEL